MEKLSTLWEVVADAHEDMGDDYWANRHREAWDERLRLAYSRPGVDAHERAIVCGVKAWIQYAEATREAWGEQMDDYVLGVEWQAWGAALLGLLNGETGRLDCGTVDGIIRNVYQAAGGTGDEL